MVQKHVNLIVTVAQITVRMECVNPEAREMHRDQDLNQTEALVKPAVSANPTTATMTFVGLPQEVLTLAIQVDPTGRMPALTTMNALRHTATP